MKPPIMHRAGWTIAIALVCLGLFSSLAPSAVASELGFERWTPSAVRDEIRPRFSIEEHGGPSGGPALVIAADEREGLHGFWTRLIAVKGGDYYRFHAARKTQGVATPRRSAHVEVHWQDNRGRPVPREPAGSIPAGARRFALETFSDPPPSYALEARPEFPRDGRSSAEGWTEVAGIFRAPPGATRARVELHLRWAPRGAVRWAEASLTPTTPPSRRVRLASVFMPSWKASGQPRPKTAVEACRLFAPYVDEAAKKKADLVCLPETLTTVLTNLTHAEAAEPIPGPSTKCLGELARQHDLYLVAGLVEREEPCIYNTAVLIGPDGALVGKYRKTCLTPQEGNSQGLTPGREFPVFQTRFGKVGMMICWDMQFPEMARGLCSRGAEILAVPVAGNNPVLAQARAIENQVYVVTSTYTNRKDWLRTAIYNYDGSKLAWTEEPGSVIVAEVDLDQPKYWAHLGDLQGQIPRQRPPADVEESRAEPSAKSQDSSARQTGSSTLDSRRSKRPHTIFILADDLGYGDLGCYGRSDIRTPELDKLATEGVRFTAYYAAGAECTPTRAALLTGRYPQRIGGLECAIGVGNVGRYDDAIRLRGTHDLGLPTESQTIVRLLKSAGYATALFGKWHLGYEPKFSPRAHGFDEAFYCIGGDLDYFHHRERSDLHALFQNGKPIQRDGYFTDLVTDEAVRFIAEQDGKRPFFLYVPYTAPHAPFQGPNDSHLKPLPDDSPLWSQGHAPPDAYRAMIQRMDQGIGKILQALDEQGLAEQTLVLFASDNGGTRSARNAPFSGIKGSTHEGGIRVPAIARWPGVLPVNAVYDQPCITMDFTASMAQAAGIEPAADQPFDGVDILGQIAAGRPPEDRRLYWRKQRDETVWRAVRDGHLKFVSVQRGDARPTEQLFNLAADPAEQHDLQDRQPDDLQRLKKLYEDWETEVRRDRRGRPTIGKGAAGRVERGQFLLAPRTRESYV